VSVVDKLYGVRQWTHALLNFILPPTCANCGHVGALICADCLAEMPWLRGQRCATCGRKTASAQQVCDACRRRPPRLRQVQAALAYDDPLKRVIHRLKYERMFALAAPLADLMLTAWPDWFGDFDALVPVPLHAERQRARGYNQSTLLAERLAARLGLVVAEELLQRTRYTPPQVGLNAAERLDNVRGAFTAATAGVVGRHILLIDDVYTTGATTLAAADALLLAGAGSVSAYCLARTA